MDNSEDKNIIVDGQTVRYRIAGVGKPIIILHGWGSSLDSWVGVQQILAEKGFLVVTVDLPGFKGTLPPPTVWGIEEYANFVKQFAATLGFKKFTLLGHSFGGQIAICFALAYPDTLPALILCGAAGIRRRTIRTNIFLSLTKVLGQIFTLPFLKQFKDKTRELFYRAIRRRDYFEAQGIMKEVMEKILREDLTHELSRITIKTLIVWGKLDTITPLAYAREMGKHIHDSIVEVVENAGHSPHKDRPQEFTNIILSFLKDIPS